MTDFNFSIRNFLPNEDSFQNLKNSIVSNVHNIAEPYVPLLKETQYSKNGTLTPKEFIEAGDLLCMKCPSWSWACSGEKKTFLPENKQYLITKNVPKNVYKNLKLDNKTEIDFTDVNSFVDSLFEEDYNKFTNVDKIDEFDDFLEEFVDDSINSDYLDNGNGNNSNNSNNNNVLRTRTYDMHITYDRYYRGPKLWISGRNENGRLLTFEELMSDINKDYANKTATLETHPHLNIPYFTVHNCRHADILKKFSDGSRPDMSLFLFLKFMSSMMPDINYDFTTSLELK
jgi:ubiquitin-like-conjugating enzyme ATG3